MNSLALLMHHVQGSKFAGVCWHVAISKHMPLLKINYILNFRIKYIRTNITQQMKQYPVPQGAKSQESVNRNAVARLFVA